MIDIQYFLDIEDKYNETCHNAPLLWYEEDQDHLSFLTKRPFRNCYEGALDYIKKLTEKFNLTEIEMVMLGLFIGNCSAPFRDDYYRGVKTPELAQYMFEILNNVVKKAPSTDSHTLYRFCNNNDKSDMIVGDVLFVPHNLTCTIDKWNRKDCNIYVIQTLAKEKTRAHDLYKMYPHGGENQVNFIRDSRFIVTNKEKIVNTDYNIFFMKEKIVDI